MRKTLWLAVSLLALSGLLPALEAGVIAGGINRPPHAAYGLSVGSGFPVPFIKLEFELYQIADEPGKSMSAAIKLRPKLGPLSPYVALGAGAQFSKLSFRFKEDYDGYTFLALGTHLQLIPRLSLRFDLRFLNYAAGLSRTRITGGVFFHL